MLGSYRVGLIGCGNIALNEHVPALRALSGARLIAIADPVEARRRKVQATLGLPDDACFADHRPLLAAGVDYVTLTVPQKYRRAIVEDCAKAKAHVLSEKPIATAPADAQVMINCMRASNLRYGLVHNYLFYPEYRLARELIEAGAIGKVRHVSLNFLGVPDRPGAAEYRPQWRHNPAEAGGGILMDMVHVLYLAEFLLGGAARSVSAVVDNLEHPGEAVEDFTLAHYAFDGAYASVNMWWGEGPGGLEISGTDGRILVFYQNYATGPFTELAGLTLVNRGERREFHPRPASNSLSTFGAIHEDFLDALRKERDPVAPAEAGLRGLEAALAAYASAATGQVVSLPLSPADPVYQLGAAGIKDLAVWPTSPLVRRGLFGLHL